MFTVTTPASDSALLTEAEAREAIGDSSADVTNLVRRVSAAIVRACRVPASGSTPPTLRLETLTETFRLKSTQEYLVLARFPVVSITSVTEDGAAVDAADYEIDGHLLRRLDEDAPSSWSASKIVVVYRAGWETVPDDLRLAAMKLAALFHSEASRVDSNLKSVSIPGVEAREYWVSPEDDPAMPQEVLDLLAPYRHHVVG